MWASLFLLILIYGLALVNVYLVDVPFGIITSVSGLVGVIFLLITQACMQTGGCAFMAWLYVFLYVALLLTLIFVLALVLIARQKQKQKETETGADAGKKDETNADNKYTGTDSKFLGSNNDAKSFMEERAERIRHMLYERRTGGE